jgi:hypothetical protein
MTPSKSSTAMHSVATREDRDVQAVCAARGMHAALGPAGVTARAAATVLEGAIACDRPTHAARYRLTYTRAALATRVGASCAR